MRSIRLIARGGPEAFAYEEAPQPRPGEGEVLVRVHAAGVIHTELSWVPTWTTRAGEPRPLPVIPGHEFSGEIAALGAGARDVGVQDLVYGLTDWYRDSAQAEYCGAPRHRFRGQACWRRSRSRSRHTDFRPDGLAGVGGASGAGGGAAGGKPG